jgi:hypothetical protein
VGCRKGLGDMGKNSHKTVDVEASHEKVLKLVAESDNIGDVALKGHLYVEYWLNELFIAKWGAEGSALVERSWQFSRKLTIAKKGLLPTSDMYLVPLLQFLNECRNAYAHDLFRADLVGLMKTFSYPDLEQFSEKHFDTVEAWALVYLKVLVSIACIELIFLGRVASGRPSGTDKYAETLKWNALNRLQPPQRK